MSEEKEFNVKRAYLIAVVSLFTFTGLILYFRFSNLINSQTELVLALIETFVAAITGVAIRKIRDEQKERKKEIERYHKW